MNDEIEKQKYAIFVLTEVFRRSLLEHMGWLDKKPSIELVAWSKALIAVEHACREQLLSTDHEGL